MYELKLISEESIKKHEQDYGNYNDPPPNFIQISEEEFSKSKFFSETIKYIEFRQITRFNTEDKNLRNALVSGVKLFHFYDGTGIGLSSDFWRGKTYFFKFGKCFHDYIEMSQEWCIKNKVQHFGRCYHVYKCKKCDLLKTTDSSD